MSTEKYEISNQFKDGMARAIGCQGVIPKPSEHWLAGWRAGKEVGHLELNKYIESLGFKPWGIVKLQETASS